MIILFTCETHGPLGAEGVTKKGKEGANNVQRYRCKACYRALRQKNYEAKKGAILQKCAEYRKRNPEKLAAIKRASRIRNKHKHVESERIRHRKEAKRAAKELHDWYVRKVLKRYTELRSADIPQGLVEVKRQTIKINRKLKQIREEKHERKESEILRQPD